jgi:hypothetical protein
VINELKKEIVQQLAPLPTIQEVASFEKATFTGFPAVSVVHVGNQNAFFTTASNERIFQFAVTAFIEIERVPYLMETGESQREKAEAAMGELVDSLLDCFDRFYQVNPTTLPQVHFLEAVPAEWGYAKLGEGWCRTARIDLRFHQEFTYS